MQNLSRGDGRRRGKPRLYARIFRGPVTRNLPPALWCPFKQRPELVGRGTVDGIGTAGVAAAAEQKFAAAIAVSIHGVDQFHVGIDFEMARVGLREEQAMEFAFEICSSDQGDFFWNGIRIGGLGQVGFRREHENGFVGVGEIEDAQLDIVE